MSQSRVQRMRDESGTDERTLWRQIHDPGYDLFLIGWVTIGLPILVGASVAHLLRSGPRWLRMLAGWTSGVLVMGVVVLLSLAVVR